MALIEFLEEASDNLSSLVNVSFIIELFIMSVNIGKYVSTESIKTFTGIQELMADFFLFKDLRVLLLL